MREVRREGERARLTLVDGLEALLLLVDPVGLHELELPALLSVPGRRHRCERIRAPAVRSVTGGEVKQAPRVRHTRAAVRRGRRRGAAARTGGRRWRSGVGGEDMEREVVISCRAPQCRRGAWPRGVGTSLEGYSDLLALLERVVLVFSIGLGFENGGCQAQPRKINVAFIMGSSPEPDSPLSKRTWTLRQKICWAVSVVRTRPGHTAVMVESKCALLQAHMIFLNLSKKKNS
jgi:hypothetical protein